MRLLSEKMSSSRTASPSRFHRHQPRGAEGPTSGLELSLRGVDVAYGAVRALQGGVSVGAHDGETVMLLGTA
ncbi:MAG: hypothetical protein EXR29_06455 [Betaproteobacteria bacterium]|nr:hypothetical protein [Betaproteobacteria bacterium]